MEKSDYNNPLDEINGILEKQSKHKISPELTSKLYKNSTISSEKMLLNYTSDNPRIFHTTIKDIFNARTAVETKLTDGFTKALPIVLILAGVMGFVVLVSNVPIIIDSVAKNFGVEKQVITEHRTVYVLDGKELSEAEAKAQGLIGGTSGETPPPPPVPTQVETVPTPNVVSSRCPVGTIAIDGECKKEGFDILGNLAPKPIPLKTPSTTKTNKPLCDAGSTRSWNTTVAKWYCIDQNGVATPQKVGYTE